MSAAINHLKHQQQQQYSPTPKIPTRNLTQTTKIKSLSNLLNVQSNESTNLDNTHDPKTLESIHFKSKEDHSKQFYQNSLVKNNIPDSKFPARSISTEPEHDEYLIKTPNKKPTNNLTTRTTLKELIQSSPILSYSKSKNSKSQTKLKDTQEDYEIYQIYKDQIKNLLNEKNRTNTPDLFPNYSITNHQDSHASLNHDDKNSIISKSSNIDNERLFSKRFSVNMQTREIYSAHIKSKDNNVVSLRNFMPKSDKKNSLIQKQRKLLFITENKLDNFKHHRKKAATARSSNQNDNEQNPNGEIQLLSKIGADSFKKFTQKVNLYNKYYSNYLIEPQQKFQSPNDLNIRSESTIPWIYQLQNQINDMTLKQNTRRSSIKVRTSFVARPSIMVNPEQNKINDPSVNQTIKNLSSKNKKIQLELYELEKTKLNGLIGSMQSARAKTTQEENQIAFIDQSAKKMEALRTQFERSRPLTKDEINFLKLVKDGAVNDIEAKLANNPHYANIQDMMNESPLHWAAKRGYDKIVNLLLKYNADIFSMDLANRTPRDIAHLNGHKKIEMMLMSLEEKFKKQQTFHSITKNKVDF